MARVTDTLGFLETTSIAKGVEICDTMLKASYVDLVSAKASCPGKYYIIISGDVSSVTTSINQGVNMGKGYVVYHSVLSKIHPSVIQAINVATIPEKVPALGVLEFYSVTASLMSADIAVKAANVQIVDLRLGTGIGGKSFLVLAGELTSVRSAVSSAINSLDNAGLLIGQVVVSNPKRELIESLY
ncbi:MAG: BMC domain-containing protein [Defluviitaleaceae bacterium]|nr:BMC domain-containing protein [Defluviitaleaceae bacterium]